MPPRSEGLRRPITVSTEGDGQVRRPEIVATTSGDLQSPGLIADRTGERGSEENADVKVLHRYQWTLLCLQ
jgi:hypothetical protein